MPVLETASLVVAIGSLLIETPRIATGIHSLKPSASELTEKMEARLKEILAEIKENQTVISRAEIVEILHTHSEHKARLVKLRRECPSSFTFSHWWHKRGKHRQQLEEFFITVEEFHAQVMDVSESANTQAILENTQMSAPEAHMSPTFSSIQVPAPESTGSSIHQLPLSSDIPLQPISTIA